MPHFSRRFSPLICSRREPYGTSTVLTPPRVLVVDDERYVRGLLSELLTVWGCEADLASSGSEGLRLFKQRRYDLVLSDWRDVGGVRLPHGLRYELNGTETARVRIDEATVGAPPARSRSR